ncbi:hypothetical protein BET01_13655 [Lacrimispora algidixylanolytica]|uniref:Uncharacterized protein n=1 Tax=Lacrimispora algidixylanolytica TaxID=94868 RepID=A0A419T7L3_9FIRM|nr:hypothetical protein BET01_13655 [Lacrimispora algidixylanolytica]
MPLIELVYSFKRIKKALENINLIINFDVIIIGFVGKITRNIGLRIEYNKEYKEMWKSGRLSSPRLLFR